MKKQEFTELLKEANVTAKELCNLLGYNSVTLSNKKADDEIPSIYEIGLEHIKTKRGVLIKDFVPFVGNGFLHTIRIDEEVCLDCSKKYELILREV